MKTFKTTIVILLVCILASCSKDEVIPTLVAPIVYEEESPLSALLSRMHNTNTFPNSPGGMTQAGYIFKPMVSGKINAIIVKIPATNNALKVFYGIKLHLH